MMHDKQKPEKYFNAEKNEFQNTICQIKIIFPEKLFLGHFIWILTFKKSTDKNLLQIGWHFLKYIYFWISYSACAFYLSKVYLQLLYKNARIMIWWKDGLLNL